MRHDHHARRHRHDDVARLEAEGTLTSVLTDDALAEAARLLHDGGTPVHRVVDLGCGPGVGSVALARAFTDALVIAVDSDAGMLARTTARAAEAGAGTRVETRSLDFDGDLRCLGRVDLVWAGMSIHHAANAVATLRQVRSLIDPDGLVCILERALPLEVRVGGELGRPGIWDRVADAHARWYDENGASRPGAFDADASAAILAGAGLSARVARTLSREVPLPATASMRAFAAGQLRRAVVNLAGMADAGDLAAIAAFVDTAASTPEAWEGALAAVSRTMLVAGP